MTRFKAGGAAGLCGVIGLGLMLAQCSGKPSTGHGGAGGRGGAGGGRPPVTVGVATVALGDMPVTLAALGSVTPLATINVNARVAGALDQVAFREGQMVRKGQLLAVIDPRPFKIALDQALAQLQRDQAVLSTAEADLARYKTLRAQDSVAGQTYDTQTALVRQDQAVVAADQAAVASARLNLSFTRITSPVAGRVGLRQIDAGNQIVANSSTPVAVVTQIDPITVVFSLPESQIAQVVAHHGGAGLPVTALDRAGGQALAQGTLETLDNEIDTATGTVKAKAVFANAGGALFPNQFVNVALLVETLHNQVIAPTTAIRHGPTGDYVWLLQPGAMVKAQPVTTGAGSPETVAVLSGLQPGQVVITDGGDRLKDGAKVVLPRPDSGGGASAGPAAGPGGQPGQHGHTGQHHHGAWGGARPDASAAQAN